MTITIKYKDARFDDDPERSFGNDEIDRIEFEETSVADDEITITVHKEPKETEDDTFWAFRADKDVIVSSQSD